MSLSVGIVVEAPAWSVIGDLDALTGRTIAEAVRVSGVKLAKDCELCVSFVDDAQIRELNAQWRGMDKPTNVLSFPTPGALAKKPLLGDVIIAQETAAREALEQDKGLRDHTAHLIIHGFLHLIGYDHETPSEAEEMEALERRIAAALGLRDPYEDTAPIEGAGGNGLNESYVDTK